MTDIRDVWVYLAASPLLHLALTLQAYQAGNWVYRRTGHNQLFNPVLIAVVIVIAILVATGTTYQTYFEGAQFVHFLLGPATVALAIPLYQQFAHVLRSALAILASVVVGSMTAAGSAMAIAWFMGASRMAFISIIPKSVTAPVAMAIVKQMGGVPSLTAVLVITTGIFGSIAGPPLLDLLRIGDWQARGFALGTASHGIGTARALEDNSLAGAFAGLALGLNAIVTAVLLSLVWHLFV